MDKYQYRVIVSGCNTSVTSNAATLTVNPRAIEVTADAKSKTYGESDPALTYKVTNGSLVVGDAFSGALIRASGENVGNYAINQNNLSAGSNYNLIYMGANLVITKADPVINVEAYSGVYDGAAHGATGTAKGVKGEDLTGLSLGFPSPTYQAVPPTGPSPMLPATITIRAVRYKSPSAKLTRQYPGRLHLPFHMVQP